MIVDAAQINIAGPGTNSGNITYNSPSTGDPLAYIPAPNPNSLTVQSTSQMSISSGSVTLQPGVYIGGISITGTAVVTLNPGIYYLQGGGFYISTPSDNEQDVLIGNGVMLYNAPQSSTEDLIDFSNLNLGEIDLTAPTSGLYQGMLIFQDRSSTNPVYS